MLENKEILSWQWQKNVEKKLVSEPNYESCTTFWEHLMAIELRKRSVLMDKPILVGQTILDKRKELMRIFVWVFKAKVQR